jgi:hypothetical protein
MRIINYFQYKHVRGQALLHAGRQSHATLPVTSGTRMHTCYNYSLLPLYHLKFCCLSVQQSIGARLNLIVFVNTSQSFNRWSELPAAVQLHTLQFLNPVYHV